MPRCVSSLRSNPVRPRAYETLEIVRVTEIPPGVR